MDPNPKKYFSEYCNSSGIHGLRYLGESGRFVIEKLVWTAILIVMFYLCITLILEAHAKWKSSPVIVTFATAETPIWHIPFPAVTICPAVKSDPDVFNFSDVFIKKLEKRNITSEENEIFEALTLICVGIDNMARLVGYIRNAGSLTVNWSTIENIFKVTPNNLLVRNFTGWLGQLVQEDLFSEIYTSLGLCYTFNMLDPMEIRVDAEEYGAESAKNRSKSRKWTVEYGYLNDNKEDEFPRRTFSSGMISGGLIVNLVTYTKYIDRICTDTTEGYQIAIHSPMEFPNIDTHFNVPFDHIVTVAIKPNLITGSEKLKPYDPERRKCYFNNERHLAYFYRYSQRNCFEECLANFTLKKCGCVGFYMPRLKSFPLCGSANLNCVKESEVDYLLNNFNKSAIDCNCLTTCNSLEYEIEISQNNWPWRETLSTFRNVMGDDEYSKIFGNVNEVRSSRLIVYFKEMQFLSLERHQLYGIMEFFSNVGGLLGLFVGFSLTTAIEILYFLTLRLFCNIKKYGFK